MKKLYWGIALLVLISPLGLLAKGTAWGEWSSAEFKRMIGFMPGGMRTVESLWRAPLADYAFGGRQGAAAAVGYILSGAIGVGLILIAFKVFGRFLSVPEEERSSHEDT
ncbi:MAG: PDGLE domain-containing protein [Actinomycetota bacterium]|nr:PDGLE domain-containing protein [Actinomycetota bacterium]